MTVDELEKELKNEKLQSMYLFYGEERFLLESSVKKIIKLFGEIVKGINYVVIDENNLNSLISEIETPSFGFEKKLIICKNSGLLKKEGKRKNIELINLKEKLNEYITQNINILNETVILIIIEDDIQKNDLISTIEKYGVVVKFEAQKPIQLEKRIKSICNGYSVNIDNETIKYFIECCGTNMKKWNNKKRRC